MFGVILFFYFVFSISAQETEIGDARRSRGVDFEAEDFEKEQLLLAGQLGNPLPVISRTSTLKYIPEQEKEIQVYRTSVSRTPKPYGLESENYYTEGFFDSQSKNYTPHRISPFKPLYEKIQKENPTKTFKKKIDVIYDSNVLTTENYILALRLNDWESMNYEGMDELRKNEYATTTPRYYKEFEDNKPMRTYEGSTAMEWEPVAVDDIGDLKSATKRYNILTNAELIKLNGIRKLQNLPGTPVQYIYKKRKGSTTTKMDIENVEDHISDTLKQRLMSEDRTKLSSKIFQPISAKINDEYESEEDSNERVSDELNFNSENSDSKKGYHFFPKTLKKTSKMKTDSIQKDPTKTTTTKNKLSNTISTNSHPKFIVTPEIAATRTLNFIFKPVTPKLDNNSASVNVNLTDSDFMNLPSNISYHRLIYKYKQRLSARRFVDSATTDDDQNDTTTPSTGENDTTFEDIRENNNFTAPVKSVNSENFTACSYPYNCSEVKRNIDNDAQANQQFTHVITLNETVTDKPILNAGDANNPLDSIESYEWNDEISFDDVLAMFRMVLPILPLTDISDLEFYESKHFSIVNSTSTERVQESRVSANSTLDETTLVTLDNEDNIDRLRNNEPLKMKLMILDSTGPVTVQYTTNHDAEQNYEIPKIKKARDNFINERKEGVQQNKEIPKIIVDRTSSDTIQSVKDGVVEKIHKMANTVLNELVKITIPNKKHNVVQHNNKTSTIIERIKVKNENKDTQQNHKKTKKLYRTYYPYNVPLFQNDVEEQNGKADIILDDVTSNERLETGTSPKAFESTEPIKLSTIDTNLSLMPVIPISHKDLLKTSKTKSISFASQSSYNNNIKNKNSIRTHKFANTLKQHLISQVHEQSQKTTKSDKGNTIKGEVYEDVDFTTKDENYLVGGDFPETEDPNNIAQTIEDISTIIPSSVTINKARITQLSEKPQADQITVNVATDTKHVKKLRNKMAVSPDFYKETYTLKTKDLNERDKNIKMGLIYKTTEKDSSNFNTTVKKKSAALLKKRESVLKLHTVVFNRENRRNRINRMQTAPTTQKYEKKQDSINDIPTFSDIGLKYVGNLTNKNFTPSTSLKNPGKKFVISTVVWERKNRKHKRDGEIEIASTTQRYKKEDNSSISNAVREKAESIVKKPTINITKLVNSLKKQDKKFVKSTMVWEIKNRGLNAAKVQMDTTTQKYKKAVVNHNKSNIIDKVTVKNTNAYVDKVDNQMNKNTKGRIVLNVQRPKVKRRYTRSKTHQRMKREIGNFNEKAILDRPIFCTNTTDSNCHKILYIDKNNSKSLIKINDKGFGSTRDITKHETQIDSPFNDVDKPNNSEISKILAINKTKLPPYEFLSNDTYKYYKLKTFALDQVRSPTHEGKQKRSISLNNINVRRQLDVADEEIIETDPSEMLKLEPYSFVVKNVEEGDADPNNRFIINDRDIDGKTYIDDEGDENDQKFFTESQDVAQEKQINFKTKIDESRQKNMAYIPRGFVPTSAYDYNPTKAWLNKQHTVPILSNINLDSSMLQTRPPIFGVFDSNSILFVRNKTVNLINLRSQDHKKPMSAEMYNSPITRMTNYQSDNTETTTINLRQQSEAYERRKQAHKVKEKVLRYKTSKYQWFFNPTSPYTVFEYLTNTARSEFDTESSTIPYNADKYIIKRVSLPFKLYRQKNFMNEPTIPKSDETDFTEQFASNTTMPQEPHVDNTIIAHREHTTIPSIRNTLDRIESVNNQKTQSFLRLNDFNENSKDDDNIHKHMQKVADKVRHKLRKGKKIAPLVEEEHMKWTKVPKILQNSRSYYNTESTESLSSVTIVPLREEARAKQWDEYRLTMMRDTTTHDLKDGTFVNEWPTSPWKHTSDCPPALRSDDGRDYQNEEQAESCHRAHKENKIQKLTFKNEKKKFSYGTSKRFKNISNENSDNSLYKKLIKLIGHRIHPLKERKYNDFEIVQDITGDHEYHSFKSRQTFEPSLGPSSSTPYPVILSIRNTNMLPHLNDENKPMEFRLSTTDSSIYSSEENLHEKERVSFQQTTSFYRRQDHRTIKWNKNPTSSPLPTTIGSEYRELPRNLKVFLTSKNLQKKFKPFQQNPSNYEDIYFQPISRSELGDYYDQEIDVDNPEYEFFKRNVGGELGINTTSIKVNNRNINNLDKNYNKFHRNRSQETVPVINEKYTTPSRILKLIRLRPRDKAFKANERKMTTACIEFEGHENTKKTVSANYNFYLSSPQFFGFHNPSTRRYEFEQNADNHKDNTGSKLTTEYDKIFTSTEEDARQKSITYLDYMFETTTTKESKQNEQNVLIDSVSEENSRKYTKRKYKKLQKDNTDYHRQSKYFKLLPFSDNNDRQNNENAHKGSIDNTMSFVELQQFDHDEGLIAKNTDEITIKSNTFFTNDSPFIYDEKENLRMKKSVDFFETDIDPKTLGFTTVIHDQNDKNGQENFRAIDIEEFLKNKHFNVEDSELKDSVKTETESIKFVENISDKVLDKKFEYKPRVNDKTVIDKTVYDRFIIERPIFDETSDDETLVHKSDEKPDETLQYKAKNSNVNERSLLPFARTKITGNVPTPKIINNLTLITRTKPKEKHWVKDSAIDHTRLEETTQVVFTKMSSKPKVVPPRFMKTKINLPFSRNFDLANEDEELNTEIPLISFKNRIKSAKESEKVSNKVTPTLGKAEHQELKNVTKRTTRFPQFPKRKEKPDKAKYGIVHTKLQEALREIKFDKRTTESDDYNNNRTIHLRYLYSKYLDKS